MYNGDGLRMSHTVSGQQTSYTWDVAAGLPVVLQDGTNTYVYGLDLISATDGTGIQTYFLYALTGGNFVFDVPLVRLHPVVEGLGEAGLATLTTAALDCSVGGNGGTRGGGGGKE